MNIIEKIISAPMVWLYGLSGNYVLSFFLYLVLIKCFFAIFDVYRCSTKISASLAKPFLAKIKDKYLGRPGGNFENASLEIMKATKTSTFGKIAPFFIEYPILIAFFNVLYKPVSLLFPGYSEKTVSDMSIIANKIVGGSFPELNILKAVHSHPAAFARYDVAALRDFDSTLFGIDILQPANLKSVSIIIPLLTLAFYAYSIISMLIPVFKKKIPFKNIALKFGLYVLIMATMVSSAFALPVVFHIYIVVFMVLGIPINAVIENIMCKKKKEWVKEANKQCQDILKKYDIEEQISALKEDNVTCKEGELDVARK